MNQPNKPCIPLRIQINTRKMKHIKITDSWEEQLMTERDVRIGSRCGEELTLRVVKKHGLFYSNCRTDVCVCVCGG